MVDTSVARVDWVGFGRCNSSGNSDNHIKSSLVPLAAALIIIMHPYAAYTCLAPNPTCGWSLSPQAFHSLDKHPITGALGWFKCSVLRLLLPGLVAPAPRDANGTSTPEVETPKGM